jgi:tRNA threonylcarbamoyladenosine biosynthesis protein TsaB
MPGFPDPALEHASDPAPLTVLAIDTTAAVCSVALLSIQATTRRCWVRTEPLTVGQSRAVLAQVDSVLQASGVSPEQIDVIGYGAGPGAFTGLRVACGVAQGLALGWSRPVIGIDSLSTLAWQARGCLSWVEPGTRILAALDVRMNEVAVAVFDAAAFPSPDAVATQGSIEACLPLLGPQLCSPDEAAGLSQSLIQQGHPLVHAGDGPAVYAALAFASVAPQASQPGAEAVADLCVLAWRAGRAMDASEATPFYLRDKVALDRQEQADLRAAREAQRETQHEAQHQATRSGPVCR